MMCSSKVAFIFCLGGAASAIQMDNKSGGECKSDDVPSDAIPPAIPVPVDDGVVVNDVPIPPVLDAVVAESNDENDPREEIRKELQRAESFMDTMSKIRVRQDQWLAQLIPSVDQMLFYRTVLTLNQLWRDDQNTTLFMRFLAIQEKQLDTLRLQRTQIETELRLLQSHIVVLKTILNDAEHLGGLKVAFERETVRFARELAAWKNQLNTHQ